MECACIDISGCDYDEAECVSTEKCRARKEHRCCECGRIIQAGETYERCSGKWDGDWERYRTCLDCLSARDQFFCKGYVFCSLWGEMMEHVGECRGNIASACLEKLTPRAREKVIDMIDTYWENGTVTGSGTEHASKDMRVTLVGEGGLAMYKCIRTLGQLCNHLDHYLGRATSDDWCVLFLRADDDTRALLADLRKAKRLRDEALEKEEE